MSNLPKACRAKDKLKHAEDGAGILNRIMDYKPEGRWKIGRPKVRGIDGLLQDMKKLEVKNWWRVATDREARRKVLAVVTAAAADDDVDGNNDNDEDGACISVETCQRNLVKRRKVVESCSKLCTN